MKESNLIKLYQNAYNFLLKQKGISEEILTKHLISESNKPDDLKIIYKRFCESAQNRQMSNKVIGGSIGGVENLSKVLFDFDPGKVTEHYSKNDHLKLLSEIEKKLRPSGQIRTTSRSL